MHLKGFNCYKKSIWNYPELESAYCEELHVPVPEFSNFSDVSMGYNEFHEVMRQITAMKLKFTSYRLQLFDCIIIFCQIKNKKKI